METQAPLQAAVARGDRDLPRLRRMGGEGRRLRDPGARRRFRQPARRLLHQRRRAAALRDDGASRRRGLPGLRPLGDPVVTGGRPRSRQIRRRATRPQMPDLRQAGDDEAYPFCSRRCANVDLNRWLSGTYVIPAAEDEPAEDEEAREIAQISCGCAISAV